MPKRKTADANIETSTKAEPGKKHSSGVKSSTSPAATHKRTASKKPTQPSAAGTADPVVIVPAADAVSVLSPISEELSAASLSMAVETPRAKFSYEQISALAYSYWERRGYSGGSAEEDWVRAERELAQLS